MPPSRSLDQAREAYELRDVELSALAHTNPTKPTHSAEKHKKAAGFMKSFIFGGMDGIITTFAVVSGCAGGDFGIDVVLALGLSSLVADALSMGVGDSLSTKSENEAVLYERAREVWEMEYYPEGEVQEMVELYMEKGVSEEDARLVMQTLSKYKDVFVDLMVRDELGLEVPDPDDNPWIGGLVTGVSFVVFGFVPLLAYIAVAPFNLPEDQLFAIACGLTAITLFFLGAVKSLYTTRHFIWSGSETLLLGGGVSTVSYVIGWAVENAVRKDQLH